MEVVNTAPSSQGLLHPKRGQQRAPAPNPPSACTPPAPARGCGTLAPLPTVLLPRRCRLCGAEHPPEQAQHPPRDPAAQGKDGAVVRHPDTAPAPQPLQDLPLPGLGPPLFGMGTQTHANAARAVTAVPHSLAQTPDSSVRPCHQHRFSARCVRRAAPLCRSPPGARRRCQRPAQQHAPGLLGAVPPCGLTASPQSGVRL